MLALHRISARPTGVQVRPELAHGCSATDNSDHPDSTHAKGWQAVPPRIPGGEVRPAPVLEHQVSEGGHDVFRAWQCREVGTKIGVRSLRDGAGDRAYEVNWDPALFLVIQDCQRVLKVSESHMKALSSLNAEWYPVKEKSASLTALEKRADHPPFRQDLTKLSA
jgi:hypothetical protein